MAGIADAVRQHERVGLDTSMFIYHMEGTSRYEAVAGTVFRDLASGAFVGVTSVLTLMEVTVKPLQLGRPDIAEEYEFLLSNYPHLTLAAVDGATALRAAKLRATHRLHPIDALHIAACLQHGASAFLTNDRDLRRVTEIQVVLLEDFIEP